MMGGRGERCESFLQNSSFETFKSDSKTNSSLFCAQKVTTVEVLCDYKKDTFN